MKKIVSFFTSVAMMAMLSTSAIPTSAETSTEPLKIMPLGDSITDGFTTVGGYRTTLCNLIQENGYSESVDFVGPNWGGDGYDPQHAGYSGYSIDNIENCVYGQRTGISSFIDWLLENYPTDIVLLQIGTNDLLSLYELDTIEVRLEALVDTILAALPEDGMLYLATIPCIDMDVCVYLPEEAVTTDEMNAYVDAYNVKIRALAEEKIADGENVELADINKVLTKLDLADGVHPSVEGYAKMGQFWYNTLSARISGEAPTDDELTIADAVALAKHLVYEMPISAEKAAKVDMDADGVLDIFDMTLLRRYLVK